jgi:hypothetical protein
MSCLGTSTLVAFIHQDVYLPQGWTQNLARAVGQLEVSDPTWAVLGVIGVSMRGAIVGRVWSSGLGGVVGNQLTWPVPVASLDEVVLVLRVDSGVRFDEALPGFHLYGTDLVQTALRAGLGAYAFEGPVIHNSVETKRLDASYRRAYRYMQNKWSERLPIPTTVMPVTRSKWPLVRNSLVGLRARLMRRTPWRERCVEPDKLARSLGFEAA